MEIVHQGYLLCRTGSSQDTNSNQDLQKIYAVLSNNVLTCYSENPAVQHYSKVGVVESFNLRSASIVDTSDSMRPKSFGIQSTTDGSFAEFVCPTNSVKFQWVKHLQVQSLSATTPSTNDRRMAPSPVPPANPGSGLHVQVQIPPTVSQPSPSPHQGASRLIASRNLAAKVLTPVPRISYNTGALDQALGTGTHAQAKVATNEHQDFGSGKILIEDGLPKWIPGSFGNKQHSSLALSPSPPRSRSASRLSHSLKSASGEVRSEATMIKSNVKASSPRPVVASYDVLASRAAPQRSHSANPVARNRENSSSTRDRAQNEAPQSRETASRSVRTPQATGRSNRTDQSANAPSQASTSDSSQQLLSKSMSNMTVAEIRAALMSMPAMVRHSLVDSNSPKNHQRRSTYHSGSPEYPSNQSAFNDTNNSSSMHEYYDERGRQDRFQKFSGDRYPAVGEFYPNEDRQGGEQRSGRREQHSHNQDYRQTHEPSQRDNQDSTAEYAYERDQEYRQEQHEEQYGEYSGAEETGSEEEQDVPEYDSNREYQEQHERERAEQDFDGQSGYEELEHCGEYERPQERAKSDRRMPQQSRRASAPSGRLQSASAAEYSSTGEEAGNPRRGHSKPQLPMAARRSSLSASTSSSQLHAQKAQEHAEYAAHRRPAERDNRESHIPRPVEPSPRASAGHRHPQPQHLQEDDSSHSLPAWGYRNQQDGRAKSAQRLPSKSTQAAQQGKQRQQNHQEEAREQEQRASSAGTTERVRYLPEQQRKETLDWSRKQAAERKLRSNFTSSPVRAVSPGVTPALKLKYRSFNNSVEKDFAGSYEETSDVEGGDARKAPQQQRRDASANRAGHHQDTGAAIAQHRSMSASRTNTQPQAAASSGANSNSGGQRSKSPMFRAFEKKPASFFEFRNARPGSNPRPSAASNGRENEHSTPAQGRAPDSASTPIATESFIRSNTQLLANYHHAQRSPGRGDRSAQQSTPAAAHAQRNPAASGTAGAGANNTITNVAEWRRLTDWLTRTGMERYVDVLRINGITKLSLVELMEPQDMKQIGIAAADIPLFQNNVSEFTNRTRSFSEQVLSKTDNTPPASPTNVPHAANHPGRNNLPRPHPAAANAGAAVHAPVGKPLPQSGQPIRNFAPSLREKEKAQRSPGADRKLAAGAPSTVSAPGPSAPVRKPSTAMPSESYGGSDSEALPETETAAIGLDEHIFSDVDQIRKELHRCFDCGDRELFFHAWKQLVLYMPEDCITLNPLHPAFYHAKQVIEFNLHLNFAVYPITHHMGKRAEKAGKLALKRYFESVMVTSEMDALLSSDASEGGDANKLSASMLSSNPVTAHSFTRSREYATYAGIVLVPEPQENIAFQTLFQPDWMESLKARLEQFLHLMSPNVEIVPTASSSVIAAAEAEMRQSEVANSNENAGDGASIRSAREKVRSFLHVKETAVAPKGTLNDFEIHFSSPVAAEIDPTRQSPALSAIKGTTLEPASPTDLDMTSKLEQDVVSPLAMSPPADEQATFRKRHIDTKHSDDSGAPRISRIASPASPVSSVISQLTDDSHRPIGSAATLLSAQEATAPTSTTGGPQASTSARKPKLKPYGSTTKKAMQSQVDMYNKLLKKSRSPTQEVDLAPSVVPFSTEQQPEVISTAQKSPDLRSASETSGSPTRRASGSNGQVNKGSSLNVGFGMKRKPLSDLPAPDQSLAAQVARYNKLLVKSVDTAEETREPAPPSPAGPPPPESAPSPTRPTEEPAVDNLARSTSSGVETIEESDLSPAEVQQMQDALLEIQNIYTSTDDAPFFGNGVTEKLEAHSLAAEVPADVVVDVELLQVSAAQDQVVAE